MATTSIFKAVRAVLQQDDTLFTLVGGRFYPSELASVVNPVLPCINFATAGAGRVFQPVPHLFNEKGVRFWISSLKSYEETHQIFNALCDAIIKKTRVDATTIFKFDLAGATTDLFQVEGRTYQTVCDFDVICIIKRVG